MSACLSLGPAFITIEAAGGVVAARRDAPAQHEERLLLLSRLLQNLHGLLDDRQSPSRVDTVHAQWNRRIIPDDIRGNRATSAVAHFGRSTAPSGDGARFGNVRVSQFTAQQRATDNSELTMAGRIGHVTSRCVKGGYS